MPTRDLRDPSSIAFAQVAEEHRRAGDFAEAVRICRDGLAHHPGFLSARVTLGQALLALGQMDDAAAQLEAVVRAAPDHLAALRGLAAIHCGRGETQEALRHYRAALTLVPRDLQLSECIAALEHEASASDGDPAAQPDVDPIAGADLASRLAEDTEVQAHTHVAVRRLEAWLDAILADRAGHTRGGTE